MMRVFALCALTMCAFAGNSILNRIGVAGAGMDPILFATVRVAAGAGVLWLLVRLRGGALPDRPTWSGAAALAVYMLGFSWAYLTLGAGLGALILFGFVQVTMFGWAVMSGQVIPLPRWLGAAVAFGGLALLLWPVGPVQVPILGALSMAVAGVAWGVYTLLGPGGRDPLAATGANFLWCLPLMILPARFLSGWTGLSAEGVAVAICAGAVTSGLGYALWYGLLPLLQTTQAAVAQLSVPVIAILAGAVLLSEPLTLRLLAASALTLGGIGLTLVPMRR